jgi:hypothetical protein
MSYDTLVKLPRDGEIVLTASRARSNNKLAYGLSRYPFNGLTDTDVFEFGMTDEAELCSSTHLFLDLNDRNILVFQREILKVYFRMYLSNNVLETICQTIMSFLCRVWEI